jgi:hypothetical protein
VAHLSLCTLRSVRDMLSPFASPGLYEEHF